MTHFRKIIPTLSALGALLAAPIANAGATGGTIIYGPASAVPTLSGGLLIALALLMAAIAFRMLRAQSRSGARMLVWATAVGALASGASGVKLISDAHAVVVHGYTVELTSETGGTINISDGPSTLVNTSGVTLQILQMNPAPGCVLDNPLLNGGAPMNGGGVSRGQCSASPSSTVLNNGDSCEVLISCGGA